MKKIHHNRMASAIATIAFLLLCGAAYPQPFGKPVVGAGLPGMLVGDHRSRGPDMRIMVSGYDEQGRLMVQMFSIDADHDGEPDNFYMLSYERDHKGRPTRKQFVSYYGEFDDTYDALSDITYFYNEADHVTDSFEEVDFDGDGMTDKRENTHSYHSPDSVERWSITLRYGGPDLSLEKAQTHIYEDGALVEHGVTDTFPTEFIDNNFKPRKTYENEE